MLTVRISKKLLITVVIVAAMVFSGIGVYAATSGGDANTIYACQSKQGVLRVITAGDTKCDGKYETELSWNMVGPKGDKGDPGAAGADGAVGPQGLKGDKGDPGAAGADGAAGPQGPKGDKGDKGDPGAAGAAGATGPQGIKGEQGAVGAVGVPGPQGAQGEKGEKGDPGDKGDKGDSGAQGPAGPQGPAGAGITPEELAALQTRMASLESTVASLQTQVQTLTDELTRHLNRIISASYFIRTGFTGLFNDTVWTYKGTFSFVDQFGEPYIPSQAQMNAFTAKVNGNSFFRSVTSPSQAETYYAVFSGNNVQITLNTHFAAGDFSIVIPGVPEAHFGFSSATTQ